MDVFLVPVGSERYEPYCEVPDEPADAVAEPAPGFFRRMVHLFQEMIADAERERRQGTPFGVSRSWLGRVRARTLRWVAEAMAEQKLLWHLRKQTSACLHYPDDLQEPAAACVMKFHLTRDLKKHRRWLAIDSVLMVVFGVVLFAVPGPNISGTTVAPAWRKSSPSPALNTNSGGRRESAQERIIADGFCAPASSLRQTVRNSSVMS